VPLPASADSAAPAIHGELKKFATWSFYIFRRGGAGLLAWLPGLRGFSRTRAERSSANRELKFAAAR
jgi:hypothetical protein